MSHSPYSKVSRLIALSYNFTSENIDRTVKKLIKK